MKTQEFNNLIINYLLDCGSDLEGAQECVKCLPLKAYDAFLHEACEWLISTPDYVEDKNSIEEAGLQEEIIDCLMQGMSLEEACREWDVDYPFSKPEPQDELPF